MTTNASMTRDYLIRDYKTIESVRGPLIFVQRAPKTALGDLATIFLSDKESRSGQVIEVSEKYAVIQVFELTERINPKTTAVRFHEEGARFGLSPLILGRIFTGGGEPMDGLPKVAPIEKRDILGSAINPVRRDMPRDFIQTGISAIDGLNTLVRGQKLPIFSGSGLPANEIANHIISNAGVQKKDEKFALVFAGMGITSREADYFRSSFENSGAIEHSVVFINIADDPVIERLLTPRFALTTAEYLAYELDMQVLVVLSDMSHYCNALREIASSREEIPGRRGYPGYMYTDLAGIYERAGRVKGRIGSVTQLPILTMPDDDITHPIPDLTGYITEGQIVLDRGLHRKGVSPPINVLPSLSRLMDQGIGDGRTREDHRQLADQLYMAYARGEEQKRVASIIGEEGLSEIDRKYLHFSDAFEKRFIHQASESRSIMDTLGEGWDLLKLLPETEWIRISREMIGKYKKQ